MSNCTQKDCEKLFSSADKWRVSILAGIVFMVLSSPILYRVLDNILEPLGLNVANGGCPTLVGLLVATALFIVVSRLMMN